MSPRNYHAKFTKGSDPDFWWSFSKSNSIVHYKENRKNSIVKKFLNYFKKSSSKDFKWLYKT